jgi:signal transduction histidine kinase
MLRLSRVSRANMNMWPVDLSVAATSIEELRYREPGRQVRFNIREGIWVNADPVLIRVVAQNLLENAWKFTTRQDDAVIELAAASAEEGETCRYVRDNGAGFDQAYAEKLFRPFERLRDARDFPGHGIGLASVQRIVKRHGGADLDGGQRRPRGHLLLRSARRARTASPGVAG